MNFSFIEVVKVGILLMNDKLPSVYILKERDEDRCFVFNLFHYQKTLFF